jgi:anti-sigma-K factor RskA
MTWDEVKEVAPLYVIGALDEKTAHDLESSLHNASPEQRQVIALWRNVAALLHQALPLQTPPDYLKERLLNRVAGETQQTLIEIAVEESALKEMTERAENKVLLFPQPRRDESRVVRWMLIAATVLLTFAVGYMVRRESDLARKRDSLARKRDALLKEMAARTRVISMAGVEAPQANAKIVWDMNTKQWEVYVSDLPAPPSDKDYQLWYVTSNAKMSAAVFRTDSLGRAVLKLTLPSDAQDTMALTAVTLEPRGGSSQPTGKFYLKSSI